MLPLINKNGITVRQLKQLVKDLPEADEYGNSFEVWIENSDGTSSPAYSIMQLNKGDIIISLTDYNK